MNSFPKTRCPSCQGPVTFFEVMSIVTPFQSIDCSSCGEMIFLKHRGSLFFLSIVLGILVFLGALFVLVKGWISPIPTYLIGFGCLVGAELYFTLRIVKTNSLVIRKKLT
jgi:hypothetical protein